MEIVGRQKAKEIISLRVEPGECLLSKIEGSMREVGGNAIVLAGVGTLSNAILLNPSSLSEEKPERSKKELTGPLMIVSLMGTVGPAHSHGDRSSHIHVALSHHNKAVEGGVLLYGSKAWHNIEVQLLVYE